MSFKLLPVEPGTRSSAALCVPQTRPRPSQPRLAVLNQGRAGVRDERPGQPGPPANQQPAQAAGPAHSTARRSAGESLAAALRPDWLRWSHAELLLSSPDGGSRRMWR